MVAASAVLELMLALAFVMALAATLALRQMVALIGQQKTMLIVLLKFAG